MNILIMGASFSGSTLLSSLLGAHHKIFTLGELMQWYLFRLPEREGYFSKKTLGGLAPPLSVCRECGPGCLQWKNAPCPDDPEQLYAQLRRHFKSQHLVDSTKHVHWYEQVIPKCPGDKFVFVVLHKPVWAIVTSRARYMGVNASEKVPDNRVTEEVNFWNYFYRGFRKIIAEHPEHPVVMLRYEDLAKRPQEALTRILEPMDLTFESAMLNGHNTPQHQIAGNGKLKRRVRESGGKLPITYDVGVDEAPLAVRKRCLEINDARELMVWLGRGEELPA